MPLNDQIKVLVLDEELTWTEAYTGATRPRFKRWKTLPLPQLKKCLMRIP